MATDIVESPGVWLEDLSPKRYTTELSVAFPDRMGHPPGSPHNSTYPNETREGFGSFCVLSTEDDTRLSCDMVLMYVNR